MRLRGLSKASIPIGIFIGPVLLIALAAWVGDMVAAPRLEAFSEESADYLRSFKRAGFVKPVLLDDMGEDNAWDYYISMTAFVESVDIDRRFLTDFLNGVNPDTARAASLVMKSDSALSLLRKGARQRYAAAPLDYENGLGMMLPNFMALRCTSQLLACQARLDLKKNTGVAVDNLVSGLIYSCDLAGGDLSLIGHMVGIVCLSIARRQIEEGLDLFDEEQLQKVAGVILAVVNRWPPLSRNLEAEHRMASITLLKIGLDEYGRLGLPVFRKFPRELVGWWVFHLLSWRQGFSFRRTQLGAVRSGMDMVDDLADAETYGWEKVKEKIGEWDARTAQSTNWLRRHSAPNLMGMHRRHYEAVARAKLVGAGLLLEIYYRENGCWPDVLRHAKVSGLEDLFVDPITGEEFKYLVYSDDSVYVYSVGTDLEDDNGSQEEDTGDLVLVLEAPAQGG